MSKLKSTLEGLSQALNKNHPEVNYGGCAKLSAIMITELAKKGIKAKAKIIEYFGKPTITTPLEELPEDKLIRVPCDHMVTKVGRYYFDNLVVTTNQKKLDVPSGSKLYKGSLKITKLRKVIKHGEWNQTFNTKELPAIRKLVKKHLEVLK